MLYQPPNKVCLTHMFCMYEVALEYLVVEPRSFGMALESSMLYDAELSLLHLTYLKF